MRGSRGSGAGAWPIGREIGRTRQERMAARVAGRRCGKGKREKTRSNSKLSHSLVEEKRERDWESVGGRELVLFDSWFRGLWPGGSLLVSGHCGLAHPPSSMSSCLWTALNRPTKAPRLGPNSCTADWTAKRLLQSPHGLRLAGCGLVTVGLRDKGGGVTVNADVAVGWDRWVRGYVSTLDPRHAAESLIEGPRFQDDESEVCIVVHLLWNCTFSLKRLNALEYYMSPFRKADCRRAKLILPL